MRHFFERRAECRDEGVRKPIDEPDRVGHEEFAAIAQAHLSHQWIQRDEQRVGRLGVRPGEHVEQSGLAGVSVTD